MQIEHLAIEGAFRVSPTIHGDDRGHVAETFRADKFEAATGRRFEFAQANTTFSTRGVVRGVHFALVPPGQAKYVSCLSGQIVDYVIDVRVGSPTFGEHVTVALDDSRRESVYLDEGLGHAFCVTSNTATVGYYCSAPYTPDNEFGVNPLDPHLALAWPEGVDLVISPRDAQAPSLFEAEARGELPEFARCQAFLREVTTR